MPRASALPAAFLLLTVPALQRDAAAHNDDPGPQPGIAVWDTLRPAEGPLAPEALAAQAGWAPVPAGKTADAFTGDAVLGNGRIVAVVRKQAAGVDLYALGSAGAVPRARLTLVTAEGEPATRIRRTALVEHSRAAACLEVSGTTAGGAEVAARLRLRRNEVFLQAEPKAGAARVRVECPSRYVVLPDCFADDILIDPGQFPGRVAEVPSDNFLLHLAGEGDSIALCVFESKDQDAKVAFAGAGAQRLITGSEIDCDKGRMVWVALLEAPHIWHASRVEAADAGAIKRLDWKPPFPATWRCDFTRNNGLVSGWEMLLWDGENGGAYRKPSWSGNNEERLDPRDRLRWITFLGKFPYPCWIDPGGQGYVQPLRHSELKFEGPAVVYPIGRWRTATPRDAYTVADVVRGTLGVGPCEYLLDREGQKQVYKGRATCAVSDALLAIYGGNQQTARRADVDRILDDALTFVKHIRGRITRYGEFGHRMRAYLAEQKKARPELDDFLNAMDQLTAELDARVAARADEIKTPEHVAAMNAKFRKTVLGYEGSDAFNKCQQYTRALVVIGDNQDELASECRWVVKNLRQQAGVAMARDPRAAPIAREIRARAQEALRNPAYHEADRH
jgi:hypothetical protein